MVAQLVALSLTTWTALTAVGTIGAVLVALFLDELPVLRQRRREPRLTLTHSVDDSAIEVTYTPTSLVSVGVSGRAAYLRLAVSNEPGHDAARDVEVLLQRVERIHGEHGHVIERVHVASPPFGWSNVETTSLTIPAGVTRVIDVGIVDGPPDPEFQSGSPPDKPPPLVLRLGIVPEPADGRNRLPPRTLPIGSRVDRTQHRCSAL
jgi:hypothetical protein